MYKRQVRHFTQPDPLYTPAGKGWLKMYLPARTAQVLRMVRPQPEGVAKKRVAAKKTGTAKKAETTKKGCTAKKACATKKQKKDE